MRALQKLVRNSNSTAVTIPRHLLMELGWLCGQGVVLELTETRDVLVVRRPRESDFGPVLPPRMFPGGAEVKL